jgi:hypothetical protein
MIELDPQITFRSSSLEHLPLYEWILASGADVIIPQAMIEFKMAPVVGQRAPQALICRRVHGGRDD